MTKHVSRIVSFALILVFLLATGASASAAEQRIDTERWSIGAWLMNRVSWNRVVALTPKKRAVKAEDDTIGPPKPGATQCTTSPCPTTP